MNIKADEIALAHAAIWAKLVEHRGKDDNGRPVPCHMNHIELLEALTHLFVLTERLIDHKAAKPHDKSKEVPLPPQTNFEIDIPKEPVSKKRKVVG